jgi:hypothetical protein
MTSLWESLVIAAYQQHLIVALPLTILGIKMLVRFVAREPKKDVFQSLLILPLDFVYIAMGILLAAAARRDPALMKRYGTDENVDMAVVLQMISLIVSATVITVFNRWERILYQKFYSAWTLFGDKRQRAATAAAAAESPQSTVQMNLELASSNGVASSRESGILLAWIMFYWVGMVPVFLGEIALGILCLGSILGRLR